LKKLFSFLRFIIFISIGIILFWLVYKDIPMKEMWQGIKNANYFWIILALFIALLGHYSRGRRWNLLIKPLGYDIKPSRTFIAVMINYMANLALPRMGEVSRPIVINRTDKVPLDKLIGTIIIERIFDFMTLVVLTLLAVVLQYKLIKDSIYHALVLQSDKFKSLFSLKTLLIIAIVVALLIILLVLIKKSDGDFKKHPVYIKIRDVVKGFYTGIKTIKTMKNKWQFVGHTLFIWLTYYLMTYLVFFSLPETSQLSLAAGLVVLTIGSLGFIMPSPGGIGTYHFAAEQALGIYQVDKEGAKLYALIAHSSQTLTIIIVGAVCFLIFYYIQKKSKNESLTENSAENL